jgi:hypothetical protein
MCGEAVIDNLEEELSDRNMSFDLRCRRGEAGGGAVDSRAACRWARAGGQADTDLGVESALHMRERAPGCRGVSQEWPPPPQATPPQARPRALICSCQATGHRPGETPKNNIQNEKSSALARQLAIARGSTSLPDDICLGNEVPGSRPLPVPLPTATPGDCCLHR